MDVAFTKKELDLIELLEKGKSLVIACIDLGISKQVGSNRLGRAKNRYMKAVSALSKAFALSVPPDRGPLIRGYARKSDSPIPEQIA